jgi:hypothetical protein
MGFFEPFAEGRRQPPAVRDSLIAGRGEALVVRALPR